MHKANLPADLNTISSPKVRPPKAPDKIKNAGTVKHRGLGNATPKVKKYSRLKAPAHVGVKVKNDWLS